MPLTGHFNGRHPLFVTSISILIATHNAIFFAELCVFHVDKVAQRIGTFSSAFTFICSALYSFQYGYSTCKSVVGARCHGQKLSADAVHHHSRPASCTRFHLHLVITVCRSRKWGFGQCYMRSIRCNKDADSSLRRGCCRAETTRHWHGTSTARYNTDRGCQGMLSRFRGHSDYSSILLGSLL